MEQVPELVEIERRTATNQSNSQRVPITILTGFLGSGKSTLLNEILTRKDLNTRFAVIMNEFGDSKLDALMFHFTFVAAQIEKAVSIQKAGESAAEEWLELPNGCLCCTIKTSALQAIESLLIRKQGSIDYILLETTGLADPYPIINSFWVDEALESRVYLDGVVCLIDAKNISRQLGEWAVLLQQIILADVLLVSKTDLVTGDELAGLHERLKQFNPFARVINCQYGVLSDFTRILDLRAYVDCSFAGGSKDRGYLELMAALNVQEQASVDHTGIRSLRLTTRKSVNRDRFERWLFEILWSEQEDMTVLEHANNLTGKSNKNKILRAKGLLRVRTSTGPDRDIVIQAVQELYEITELTGAGGGSDDEMEGVLVLLGVFADENGIRESFYSSIY